MFDLWLVIITACFYMRVGALASLGFALQAGVGKGHLPQAAFSAALYRIFQCLFYPTIISHALFCPQSSLILFSCAGSTGFSCSISLTILSLLSSTALFHFQSILSSVSWPQLLPVSLCNQMGQLLFCSWKHLNFQKCFYIFFPDVFQNQPENLGNFLEAFNLNKSSLIKLWAIEHMTL